jgi:hypothetical protein
MFHVIDELPFVFQILIEIDCVPIRIIFPTIFDLPPVFVTVLVEDGDATLGGTRVAELECVDIFHNA